jgi:hypothetical protein
MDACYFVLPGESGALVSVMLPELRTTRAIVRLMAVRARLRLLEGNTDAATDDVAVLLRASRHLQDQPILIQYLVRLNINRLAYRVLLDMPRLAPRAPDYEKVLSKPKDVFGSETSADSLRLSPAVSFEAMTKQIDDYYDQWRSAWTGDFKNARSVSERLEEEAKRNPQSIVGLVGPALGRLVGIYYAALASRNGAQVVLELHAYRATNGKWPQTLEEGLSKSVARPRIDPFSGRPFIYG